MSVEDHYIFVQEINIPCLKNLEAVKAYVAAQVIGNAGGQDDEDDICTVIEGENNAGNEIPQVEENILNQGDNLLSPLLHALQGTLEDPLSLSSSRDKVTKSGSRK